MQITGERIRLTANKNNGVKYVSFTIENEDTIMVIDKTIKEVEALLGKWSKAIEELKYDTVVFKVNPSLSVKFEFNQTVIYVNGKRFNQCKYLLINIPTDKIEEYDEIKSIDDAESKQMVDGSLERPSENIKEEYGLSPEQEFQGHCSNLQAWYENEYDTRLLHRNLAFSLLKALAVAGDLLAKKRYKDEIALRLEAGEPNVFEYLSKGGYFSVFGPEELSIITDNINNPLIKLMLLSKEGGTLYGQFEYSAIINGLTHKNYLKIVIVSHDNTFFHKPTSYRTIQSIYDPLEMELVGKKFLDFKNRILLSDKKIVYSVNLIKIAKEILRKEKDIEISVPKYDGYLEISSNKLQLKVLIFSEYLMR